MSKNAFSTLMRDLAEVSMKRQPKSRASFFPSGIHISKCVYKTNGVVVIPSVDTSRSASRSHLLPQTMIGK